MKNSTLSTSQKGGELIMTDVLYDSSKQLMTGTVVKNGSLNVRKTTSVSSEKVTSYKKGATIICSMTKTVKSDTWGRVVDKNGKFIGWCLVKRSSLKTPYVDFSGSAKKINTALKSEIANSDTARTNKTDTTEVITPNATVKKASTSASLYVSDTPGYVNYVDTQYTTGPVVDSIDSLGGYTPKRMSRNRAARDLQNNYGFPRVVSTADPKNPKMNYTTNYSALHSGFSILRKSLNIDTSDAQSLYRRYSKKYNRFKVPTLNDVLTKGFAHVFFTRPSCGILKQLGSGNYTLSDTVKNNPVFKLANKTNKSLLYQLSIDGPYNHDFGLYLSNKATSFEGKDVAIDSDTYGKSLRGNSIAYGKHNVKSKAASEFSVNYIDDRNLHVLNLHNYWVEYISGCYTGRFMPNPDRILQKELDYACSVYYIVTAENGEDIIYWAKYYGVFPTNVPGTSMSWQKGQLISSPEVSITYQYSFYEPLNPEILYEFNLNTSPGNYKYAATYQPDLLSTGNTWVGAPFIEFTKRDPSNPSSPPCYKLRFKYE